MASAPTSTASSSSSTPGPPPSSPPRASPPTPASAPPAEPALLFAARRRAPGDARRRGPDQYGPRRRQRTDGRVSRRGVARGAARRPLPAHAQRGEHLLHTELEVGSTSLRSM